ncbi:MAG: hypothetical protein Q9171_004808 [Xanthocarpia ochracea]
MAPNHRLQQTLRTPSNKDIPIGEAAELDGVTQEVQDYVLFYQHRGTTYEIHLIDSPGFDDGSMADAAVLSKVAEYLNTNYKFKERLAGVLYLHDITKGKVGGVAQRNIRMLESMIGGEKFDNCTLVTTKWGCSNPKEENSREASLRSQKKYFGSMLQNEDQDIHHNATMARFDPKTKTTALSIIRPYLENKFTPKISSQMVDPKGPKLALGETEAGKVVADNLKKLAQTEQQLAKVQAAQQLLAQKYDETLFKEFKQKRKKLRRQIALQRSGRWVMRTTIVGGAIVATVLTLGPGASAFALEPMYEKAVRGQRRNEKHAKHQLEEDFRNRSKDASYLQGKNPSWLWSDKVQNMKDLDGEAFSIKSESSEDILAVARKGEKVGVVVAGREDEGKGIEAALAGMVIGGEVAVGGVGPGMEMGDMIEGSEDSESGSEFSDSD